MKIKNVNIKEFFKLVSIMFFVIFIVSIIFLNYLIDHNILMYGFIIKDSVSLFGHMISKFWWVIIISFIITLFCTIGGLILGFILEFFISLILKFWNKIIFKK